MKFSVDWLSDYVDVAALGNIGGLRATLEQAGLPVETTEETPGGPVLDVEITPNRPDAMSHRGLSREIAAISGQPTRDGPSSARAAKLLPRMVASSKLIPRKCRIRLTP